MLFETSQEGGRQVQPHGVNSFLVDWEHGEKAARQRNFDTEINTHGVEELRAMTTLEGAVVWCRINPEGERTTREIESALDAGAGGIFLPMAKSVHEVERFLRSIADRCEAGILIETVEALSSLRDIASLPLDRVFFGMNDFAISRGGGCIFRAVLDGTVERTREVFSDTPFGFGGVTATDAGHPVPCVMLLQEMARLNCQFTFLRRSYRRDVARIGLAPLFDGVRSYWRQCLARGEQQKLEDRRALDVQLRGLCHVS